MRTFPLVLAATCLLLSLPAMGEETPPTPLVEEGQHWDYQGEIGPDHWGDLGYPTCKEGRKQSPIAIAKDASFNEDGLQLDYLSAPINVLNNGHTVQFEPTPGSILNLGGNRYELKQFHFHSPGEHVLGDTTFPMELHLVHRNPDAELAVVGVMIQVAPKGVTPSPTMETVMGSLPGRANLRLKSEDRIQPKELLPANTSYYRYTGSLTTPPCSEDVLWYVLRDPVYISEKALARFRTIFDHNARPVRGSEKSTSDSDPFGGSGPKD